MRKDAHGPAVRVARGTSLTLALAWSTVLLIPTGCVRAPAHEALRLVVPNGLDLFVPAPADNPVTTARADLGRRLFFDPILSRDSSIRCATCHDPARAFTDGLPRARGVFGRRGQRGAPSLFNVAYARHLFWDGREERLEAQVLMPISDSVEMDLSIPDAVARLARSRSYRRAFAAAFAEGITPDNIGRSLAAYLRTVLSGDAPVDRFTAGDASALSPEARRGYRLFVGRAGCSGCHFGPLFTDEQFHNTGVGWGVAGDPGRYQITMKDVDRGAFNTPSLRNVALTAPYMHDGSIADLAGVIAFYEKGGRPNPNLDPELKPVDLSEQDRRDLIAFLHALTGSGQR